MTLNSNSKEKAKRKILSLTPYEDNSCGVGTFATALNRNLEERGNEVHVLEFQPWKKENPYKLRIGDKIYNFKTGEEVASFLQENNFDYEVIHSHNQVFSDMKNETIFNQLRNVPILTQVHCAIPYANEALKGESPHNQEELQRQNRMLMRSDKVIHLTGDLENLVKEKYGVEHPSNTGVVYNFAERLNVDPLEVKSLRKRLAPNGEKLFFYAGRMSDEKGIIELFEGFREAKKENPTLKLVICGSQPKSEFIKKAIAGASKGLKEGKDFVLEGRIPQRDLPRYFSAADFFIQPK